MLQQQANSDSNRRSKARLMEWDSAPSGLSSELCCVCSPDPSGVLRSDNKQIINF